MRDGPKHGFLTNPNFHPFRPAREYAPQVHSSELADLIYGITTQEVRRGERALS